MHEIDDFVPERTDFAAARKKQISKKLDFIRFFEIRFFEKNSRCEKIS